jgi:hypothetical protein
MICKTVAKWSSTKIVVSFLFTLEMWNWGVSRRMVDLFKNGIDGPSVVEYTSQVGDVI